MYRIEFIYRNIVLELQTENTSISYIENSKISYWYRIEKCSICQKFRYFFGTISPVYKHFNIFFPPLDPLLDTIITFTSTSTPCWPPRARPPSTPPLSPSPLPQPTFTMVFGVHYCQLRFPIKNLHSPHYYLGHRLVVVQIYQRKMSYFK